MRDEPDEIRTVSVPSRFLADRSGEPFGTILLAHGAGAPMDSAWMNLLARTLALTGLRVLRFEFAYMAARHDGTRRPPPKAEALVPEFATALAGTLNSLDGPILIGGKSLGGRVATLLAGEPLDPRVRGVAAFGYPFHPPGSPERSRVPPLVAARLPVLVHQGTRDPFGSSEEVAAYALPATVRVAWYDDGDHDLAPRKASGRTLDEHVATAASATAAFLRSVLVATA